MNRDTQIRVALKPEIHEWLEAHAQSKGLSSGADLAGKLLEEVVFAIQNSKRSISGLTPEEEEILQERLRDLGYIE